MLPDCDCLATNSHNQGNNRRGVSQAFLRAEQVQLFRWWTEQGPGMTFTPILGGLVLGGPSLSLHSRLPLNPGGKEKKEPGLQKLGLIWSGGYASHPMVLCVTH